jgi:hypothetical protein
MKTENYPIVFFCLLISLIFGMMALVVYPQSKPKFTAVQLSTNQYNLKEGREIYQSLYRYEYGDTNGFRGALSLIKDTKWQMEKFEITGHPEQAARFVPVIRDLNETLAKITNGMNILVEIFGEEVKIPNKP